MRRTVLVFVGALALAPFSLLGQSGADPDLDAVRAAAERFKDVDVALAEGYIPDPAGVCETADMIGLPAGRGAMGIHYFRPDLLGITGPPNPRVDGTGTYTDFLNPAILLYEPQADGTLTLVGAENLVFEAGWLAAGNSGAPVLLGREWDHMADDPATPGDEAHGFEPHWDQHVWFRANPVGSLVPFNPNVTCEHHAGGHSH